MPTSIRSAGSPAWCSATSSRSRPRPVPQKDTLGHKIASRFRLPLTATAYGRLQSVIARVRAARHSWSILAYNCNDFVADVARGMGLRTPTTVSLPYAFIPMLQARNEDMIRRMSAPGLGRLAALR